ncbi:hypothetical protein AUJ38_01575 [bacterium CG1_02_42_9]|nr:MAG: hypothetical protein AUJ38_01575 [bacterium CG1_02_42_9]
MNQRRLKLSFSSVSLRFSPYIKEGVRIPFILLSLIFILVVIFVLIFNLSGSMPLFLQRKIFREGIVGQPQNLNPLFSSDNEIDQTISNLIFRGLTKFKPDGQWQDDLAETIDVSEDGLTYTIQIKDNIYWHDGQKLTVEDVIFTYQKIQMPDYLGFWREAFKEVSFEKIDDYHLKITLSQQLSSFPQNLTVGILPRHLLANLNIKQLENASFSLSPTGEGEFAFSQKKFQNNQKDKISLLVFKRQNGDGNINRLEFYFYPDKEALINAYKAGEIDAFRVPDEEDLEFLKDWDSFNLYQIPMLLRFYGLFFNTISEKPINKAEVRQALAYGLNKEEFVQDVFRTPPPTLFGSINSQSWAFSSEGAIVRFDSEKARQILQEAQAENLDLTLTIPDFPLAEKIGDNLKKQWEKIGVTLQIKMVSLDDFEHEVLKDRNFEVLFYGQEISSDPDQYPLWHSTRKDYPGLNLSQIQSKRIDKALEEGRQLADLSERKDKYADFQKQFQIEMPAILLYHPLYAYIVQKRVTGINFDELGIPADRFDTIDSWNIGESLKIKIF